MRGDYDVQHTTQDYDNINETISYKPEESWNYELGTHLRTISQRQRLPDTPLGWYSIDKHHGHQQ